MLPVTYKMRLRYMCSTCHMCYTSPYNRYTVVPCKWNEITNTNILILINFNITFNSILNISSAMNNFPLYISSARWDLIKCRLIRLCIYYCVYAQFSYSPKWLYTYIPTTDLGQSVGRTTLRYSQKYSTGKRFNRKPNGKL